MDRPSSVYPVVYPIPDSPVHLLANLQLLEAKTPWNPMFQASPLQSKHAIVYPDNKYLLDFWADCRISRYSIWLSAYLRYGDGTARNRCLRLVLATGFSASTWKRIHNFNAIAGEIFTRQFDNTDSLLHNFSAYATRWCSSYCPYIVCLCSTTHSHNYPNRRNWSK